MTDQITDNIFPELVGAIDKPVLGAGYSKHSHRWTGSDGGVFGIRSSWANRLQCNGCGAMCFVHRCSDGYYYCGCCSSMAVQNGEAKFL